jgi:hypothetical protein
VFNGIFFEFGSIGPAKNSLLQVLPDFVDGLLLGPGLAATLQAVCRNSCTKRFQPNCG